MSDSIEIGKRIRETREKSGLTQEELGISLGLNKSTIQRYESGKISRIKLPILEAIASELGINPEYLSLTTDDPTDYENDEDYLNAPLDALDYFNGDAAQTVRFQRTVAEDAQREPAQHLGGANAEILPDKYLRRVPTFESCSAGFGAYADSTVIGYQYLSIESDWEAENTIAVKVKGDSMYPKIEDGDIVVVCKDMDYEDGQIVVARIGDDEAVVKRIRIYPDELVLESINPEYMDRVFKREKMNDVHIEGVVRKIIKNV